MYEGKSTGLDFLLPVVGLDGLSNMEGIFYSVNV